MQEAAAFLAARLLPTSSCFVSLPEAFVRSYLHHVNPNFGATILRLSWPNGNEMEVAHVGWVGDLAQSDELEISMEFALCLRLADAMQSMPGLHINVALAPFVPVAQTVEMEPCTSDDWEIIQLHAGYLENEILRQICVVQHLQQVPIRIQQHIVVHLTALLPPDMPFARLSSNSEVIIAPKERQALAADNTMWLPSSPLVVYPSIIKRADDTALTLAFEDDEILIHPSTFALLDGAASTDPSNIICASVWKESIMPSEQLCVGRLRCSDDVVFNYVSLTRNFQNTLAIEQLDRVRIRLLKRPPLLPLRTIVTPLSSSPLSIDAFIEWLQSSSPRVLSTMSRIKLGEGARLQVDVVFHNSDATTSEPPQAAKDDYVIVGDGYYVPGKENVEMKSGAVGPLEEDVVPVVAKVLPGMDGILQNLWKNVFPSLGREGCAARTRLGATPPGSIILHGPRGAGKSSLLRALQAKCNNTLSTLCNALIVSCRDLRGMKMDAVKAELTATFEQAHRFAPCLIALDDIDALMPPESDESGISDQTRRLAEHLADLIKQSRFRGENHAAQLRHTSVNPANWPIFAAACAKNSVVVMASARESQSMHPLLRSCGLFDRPIAIPLPDVVAREKILQGLIAAVTNGKDDVSDQVQQAAFKTEGYSVRDLAQVVDRALHQGTIRARQQASTGGTPLDLMAGLEDFTPAALRGVELFKSTVEWADIGGLTEIRQTLKDTLELPTKYGKLYAAAPIKLPSGLLLYGPPGCGKTLLANAVANECGLNFISVKGPEVLNKYIGASEQAVRDLFGRAAAAAPSVLFLDEFDAMAPRRGADNTGVTDRVVNQLLTFLDGVETRQGVYVLAATSRPDMIDPALLRPGRLDKNLYCGFPNVAERLSILQAVSRKMELADDVPAMLATVAQQTELYSGADLQAVLYAAQLEAVHESIPAEADDWDMEFHDASESVSFSPKTPSSSKICTWHVQKALAASRPSVSLEAKQRYDRMYGSFKNASQPRVTEFKTAESELVFDATHPAQRSALY
ncbi:unnamed protein product [Aphanomyces euteiches]